MIAITLLSTATGLMAAAHQALAATSPDGRAYELVSPADKNGGNVNFPFGGGVRGLTAASADGERVAYTSLQSYPNGSSNPGHSYRAARTPGGWVTTDLSPNPTAEHPNIFSAALGLRDASPDLLRGLTITGNSFDPLDQDASGFSFGFDIYSIDSGGAFTWVSRGNDNQADSAPGQVDLDGHSSDFSHVVFSDTLPLVPEDAGRIAGRGLYERFGGQTTLVDVDDTGPLSNCGAVIGGLDTNGHGGGSRTAVSDDGSRVIFTTPDPQAGGACSEPSRLWVRDGDRTLEVSKSQRTIPDPSGPLRPQFQAASRDGSKIFISSPEALTDDAQPLGGATAPFLYEFDVPTQSLKLLTPNNPDTSGPDVNGVVAVSRDGSRVYFITGNSELKLYDGGQITTVATGSQLGANHDVLLDEDESARTARITDDGRYLLFGTHANVTSFDAHGAVELFLYDASEATLKCVSCNENGHAPLGDAGLKRDNEPSSLISRNLLPDGRVFFETLDSLVPADDNHAEDVYEWQPTGVRLISDGRAESGSSFVDTAADGRDVFFSTTSALVGWDTDNGDNDIYDARVGGGFPEPPKAPADCTGDACPAPDSGPPTLAAPGSSRFAGAGDTSVGPRGRFAVARITRAQKLAFARSGRLTVSVKVNVAGNLTATAMAKLGNKGARVAKSTRAVSKAGTFKIALRLSSAARRHLARVGKLDVSLSVAFSKVREHKTIQVSLEVPKTATRAASAGARASAPTTRDAR